MIYRLILSFIILVAFVADYHFAPGGAKFTFDLFSIGLFLLSVAFTWSWIIFWDVLTVGRILNPILMGLMTLIHYYELNTGGKLEASMMIDNWKGVADASGVKLLFSLFHDSFVAANVFWSLLIAFQFWLTYQEKKSRFFQKILSFRILFRFAPVVLLFILTLGFHSSFENYVGIFRGGFERVFPRPSRLQKLADSLVSPIQPVVLTGHPEQSEKPNVILVFVESLSSYFVETKSPAGLEYMPYLNSLIPKGKYFSKHYSVSVQTARGHFAALCGKIPFYEGLESMDLATHDFDCLPRYLKKEGYSSIFMQAFGKPNFDNTMVFFKNQGFDSIPQVAKVCDNELPGVPCWNWGIQDDEFYRRVIKELDQHQASPFFLALATITSHMPFQGTPENLIVHYKKPKNRFENYANTLTVVDNAFKVLIDGLKSTTYGSNTILIVTGDHGFPMGQHDNFHNENYAFEENFRVPLLILDLRRSPMLASGRIITPTSHLNLPATVLDLISYKGSTSFEGISLLEGEKLKTQPLFLVQPYSGILLGAIRWPYKYLFEKKSDKETVYNLEQDPEEKSPLKGSEISKDMLEKLRLDVATIIWQNQQTKSQR